MPLHKDLFKSIAELKATNTPFAIATVIGVEGSSSGKLGDKAIYDQAGNRLLGWIGGACVENRVAATARETYLDGNPRIINVDLDSDTMESGIPCGGKMAVIIEPQLSAPVLLIRGMGRVTEVLAQLGDLLNYRVMVQTSSEEAERYPGAEQIITDPIDIEDLDFAVDYFVLGTHHRDDDKVSLKALQMGVSYVAVVASKKKTGIIVDYLKAKGATNEQLQQFHAPAGLDLKATAAEEIALSIMSEIVMHHNGGSGKSMTLASDLGAPK